MRIIIFIFLLLSFNNVYSQISIPVYKFGYGFIQSGRDISLDTTKTGTLFNSIRNQSASDQVASFRISGNGVMKSLGLGSTALTAVNFRNATPLTGSTTAYANIYSGIIQSDVTGSVAYTRSISSTQASSFTLVNLYHNWASQGTFGAGSIVTTQAGFYVDNTLIGATNNYAVRLSIPSGTGRYNIFADGSANNYVAGNFGILDNSPVSAFTVGAGDLFQINSSGYIAAYPGTATNGVGLVWSTANTRFERGTLLPSGGGTGLATIGTAGQQLRVNTAATAYENFGGSVTSSAGTLSLSYGIDYFFTGTTSTYTLPAIAATASGRTYTISVSNSGSGIITVNTNASANVLQTTGTTLTNTMTINPGEAFDFVPNGTIIKLR